MRTIKFRVWRYCHGEDRFKFYYLDHLKITTNGGADIVFQAKNIEYFDDSVSELNEKEKVEQLTGLKDKNGKEIFEGDVLQHERTNKIFQVKYYEDEGAFGFAGSSEYSLNHTGYNLRVSRFDYVIIGNIHENPELQKLLLTR